MFKETGEKWEYWIESHTKVRKKNRIPTHTYTHMLHCESTMKFYIRDNKRQYWIHSSFNNKNTLFLPRVIFVVVFVSVLFCFLFLKCWTQSFTKLRSDSLYAYVQNRKSGKVHPYTQISEHTTNSNVTPSISAPIQPTNMLSLCVQCTQTEK